MDTLDDYFRKIAIYPWIGICYEGKVRFEYPITAQDIKHKLKPKLEKLHKMNNEINLTKKPLNVTVRTANETFDGVITQTTTRGAYVKSTSKKHFEAIESPGEWFAWNNIDRGSGFGVKSHA